MSNALLARVSEMKKVLMIARVFPPFRPVGHSIRVVKFIKYLPVLGWLPMVLTINDQQEYETMPKVGSESLLSEIEPQVKIYRTTAGEPSLKYIEKEKRFGQQNWLNRVIVKILGGTRRWAFRNIFLPDRYLMWLPFAVKCGLQIVRSEGTDVIFATCPPFSATLVGVFLKRLTGKPLILDFRDDWIDTPWYRSKPAFRRLIERILENWAVRSANKVILVTEWSKRAFICRYPTQHSDKFVLITNGCDLEDFAALNSMPKAPRNSKFTIVHAGALNVSKNWGRSVSGLFQAVYRLLQQKPELAEGLILIFAGDLPEEYRILAAEMGLSEVIKGVGHLPHDEVLRLIKSADLLLAYNYDGFSTLIPGKIYEYWAAGGPPILLLSCLGAAQELVEQRCLGITVSPDDVQAIEDAILTFYRRYEIGSPIQLSTAGIEEFDRKMLSNKLAQVLSIGMSNLRER